MLGRVVWNTIFKVNNLCSLVLRGKYGRGKNLLEECVSLKTDSNLWKALVSLWPRVLESISWEIGDRNQVRF